jgi:hypothetical protein
MALLDVPGDQVARLLGQLSVPVGQQLSDHRAGLPPGQCGAQRTERYLQPSTGPRGQGARPAQRHAEHDSQIVVIQVVPEAQLDDLTLSRLQVGQGGADQRSQFGLS